MHSSGDSDLLLLSQKLELSTDPVEIYKKWVSRTETETGQRSELPYEVDRCPQTMVCVH